jgi:hypothetical protein
MENKNNEEIGWGSWFGSFIWSQQQPLHNLPKLPFDYDPKIFHLVYFDNHIDKKLTMIISDLDYQFLKYFESLPEIYIDLHSKLKMTEFMCFFSKEIPSSNPSYNIICEFLNLTGLYSCIGNNSGCCGCGDSIDNGEIDYWIENIYSLDENTMKTIEQVKKDSIEHGLYWYPQFFFKE